MQFNADTIKTVCERIPKIELHRHLEGSLRPELLLRLARRNQINLPFTDKAGYLKLLNFRSFHEFIPVFIMGVECLMEPIDFYESVLDLGEQLNEDRILYVEVTFTPQFYHPLPCSLKEIMDALKKGTDEVYKQWNIIIRWIPDLVRNRYTLSRKIFDELLKLDHQYYGIVALGLGGPEKGYPARRFKPLFDQAASLGLGVNPHAGETAGPDSVWECIRYLRAHRIGHGVRSIENPRLLDFLKKFQVPLEICLSSNLALGIYSEQNHPIRELLNNGCRISLNTDDPLLFNTNLSIEFEKAVRLFQVSIDELKQCTYQAIKSVYSDGKVKSELLHKVNIGYEEVLGAENGSN